MSSDVIIGMDQVSAAWLTRVLLRSGALEAIEVTYDERTIDYAYDSLSRLVEADYDDGTTIYTYGFDLAGNLTNLNGVTRTYNAANQLDHDGTNALTYDANGNMTSDGTNAHTWDRANRLLSMGGISYAYNGDGNRIQQDALKYILDLQPGLSQVIGDSDGNKFIYFPRGIHAVNDGADWTYPITDALGSVRAYADDSNNILSTINYSEWGVPSENVIGPAFTGEWRSANGTQYHQARHLNPGLATWASLDPFEGIINRPMSLNGYSWVEGNVPNAVDPLGLCPPANVCDAINRNPQNYTIVEVLDCLSVSRSCDGPELLEQFRRLENLRILLDMTDRFVGDLRMLENHSTTQRIRSTRRSPIRYPLSFIPVVGIVSNTTIEAATFVDWYNFVKAGAPLDIKGNYGARSTTVWLVNGFYDHDITGNIAYGHIGKYVGFNEYVLLIGAGFGQIIGDAGTGPLRCNYAAQIKPQSI